MKSKELSKLNRRELLELLLELAKENENLTKENEQLLKEIEEKKITLNETGNIALAALKINGVFDAVQKAADQYLCSIQGIDYVEHHIDVEKIIKDSVNDLTYSLPVETKETPVEIKEEPIIQTEVQEEVQEAQVVQPEVQDVQEDIHTEEVSPLVLEELFSNDEEEQVAVYKDSYVERLDQFLNEHPQLRSFIDINEFND